MSRAMESARICSLERWEVEGGDVGWIHGVVAERQDDTARTAEERNADETNESPRRARQVPAVPKPPRL